MTGASALRHGRRSRTWTRGQGATEYILIIGLIVFTLTVAMFVFRDSVGSFANKLFSWFDALNGEKKEEPPPPPPKNPLEGLAGTWCWFWIQPDGTEVANDKKIEITKSRSNQMVWTLDDSSMTMQPTGPQEFNSVFRINGDGTISPTDRPASSPAIIRRCG